MLTCPEPDRTVATPVPVRRDGSVRVMARGEMSEGALDLEEDFRGLVLGVVTTTVVTVVTVVEVGVLTVVTTVVVESLGVGVVVQSKKEVRYR
jgi:hypothetical protein